MHHGIDQGHVRAGFLRQVNFSETHEVNAPWVRDNQACPVLDDRFLDGQTDHGVGFGGV